MWATFVTAELLPLGIWLVIYSSVHKKLQARLLLSGVTMLLVSTVAFIGVNALLGVPVNVASLDPVQLIDLALVHMVAVGVGAILSCYGPVWVQLPSGFILSAVTGYFAVQWVWRGGWLARLGSDLNLGHGAVDLGGLSMIGTLIGSVALLLLSQIQRRETGHQVPTGNQPVLAVIGTLALALGASGLFLQQSASDQWGYAAQAYQLRFGLTGVVATLFVLAYSVFVTGRVNWVWQARAILASILICSAGAVTLPLGLVIGLGVCCGLLVTVGDYIVNAMWRLSDESAAVAGILGPSLLGLLVVGLFANGSYGVGLNGVGVTEYLHMPGLGVVGLWAVLPDPGQLSAQLMAIAVLVGWTALTVGPAIWLVRAYLVAPQWVESSASSVGQSVPALTQMGASKPNPEIEHLVMPEIATADVLPDELMPQWSVQSPSPGVASPELVINAEDTVIGPAVIGPSDGLTESSQTATKEADRIANILQRLRQANQQRNRPEHPPKRAARVAYPTRVAGKRLIRPILEEGDATGKDKADSSE